MGQEFLTLGGQHDPSTTASEETQAQRLFERFDLLCDGWLGEIERLGCSSIAQVLRNSAKDGELVHGEIRRCICSDMYILLSMTADLNCAPPGGYFSLHNEDFQFYGNLPVSSGEGAWTTP